MASGTVRFLGQLTEKLKNFLSKEPRNKDEYIEKTAEELVNRVISGEVSPEEIGEWPDRLNVHEEKVVAELVFSELLRKVIIRIREFDQLIAEDEMAEISRMRNSSAGFTAKEKSLTSFFLPKYLERYIEELKNQDRFSNVEGVHSGNVLKLLKKAENFAYEYLDSQQYEIVKAERERLKQQIELIEEISKLSKNFEDEEMRKDREKIYQLAQEIEKESKSNDFGTMNSSALDVDRKIPTDESRGNYQNMKDLLDKRRENTPDHVKEQIREKYKELKSITENSKDLKEDLEILKKEKLL